MQFNKVTLLLQAVTREFVYRLQCVRISLKKKLALSFVDVLLTADPQLELVRHFLIEPTSKGVRLKGCSNEPVFGKYFCHNEYQLL